MMPTFPPSSLRCRTAGFPQYGSKAGISDRAFPNGARSSRHSVCLRPSCTTLIAIISRTVSETATVLCTAVRAVTTALPQGPSLRSGLFCPSPSPLNRPHPPHSQAHRDFAAQRLIRNALAVPFGLGDPRVVPCFRCSLLLGMPSSYVPGDPAGCLHPVSSPTALAFVHPVHGLGVPKCLPPSVSSGHSFSRLPGSHLLAHLLRPVKLLALLTDLTKLAPSHGGFYIRASGGLVTRSAAGYNYGGNWVSSTDGIFTR